MNAQATQSRHHLSHGRGMAAKADTPRTQVWEIAETYERRLYGAL
jgi:hypothetical protein